MQAQDDNALQARAKKEYETPRLTEHGSVEKITLDKVPGGGDALVLVRWGNANS